MSSYKQHQNFLKEVVLYVQDNYKGSRLFEYAVGQAYAKFSVKKALNTLLKTGNLMKAMKDLIIISYGTIGHPDIAGIYYGRWIGIEIKTGNAKQSAEQKFFEKMIKERQGIYITVNDSRPIREQLSELDKMRDLCSI